MGIREYLTESRLPVKDKRKLIKIIHERPDKSYDLNFDNKKIRVMKGNDKIAVSFMYSLDFIEVTDALVDIVDSTEEYDFDAKIKDDKTIFKVIKK